LATAHEGIGTLEQLEELELNYNQLVTIAPTLSTLPRLRSLDLSRNSKLGPALEALDGLPETLETLGLMEVGLESMPRWLSRLAHLRTVGLGGNALERAGLDGAVAWVRSVPSLREAFFGTALGLDALSPAVAEQLEGLAQLSILELETKDIHAVQASDLDLARAALPDTRFGTHLVGWSFADRP